MKARTLQQRTRQYNCTTSMRIPEMATIAYLDRIQEAPSRNQLIPSDLPFLSLNQNATPENIISKLQVVVF
jgi:hypothetical protein